MLSGKQCAEFVQVQVRIFRIDSVNGSKYSAVDNSLCSDNWRCWPSNTAMLSKDLTPTVETLMQDQQGKTNIFNLPAVIPEVKSTEFPVRADSTIDHDSKKEWVNAYSDTMQAQAQHICFRMLLCWTCITLQRKK
jgi:hypothetical protein